MEQSITLVLAIAILLSLSGCCMSHTWDEATCVAPRTCTKCGETEGEALGHVWEAATYWEPKTCSVCGKTEGSPLESYFESNFLYAKTGLSNTKTSIVAYRDPDHEYIAHTASVTFTNYKETNSSKRDYVKISFDLNYAVSLNLPRSWNNAGTVVPLGCFADYYSGLTSSGGDIVGGDNTSDSEFSVSFKGEKYTIYCSCTDISGEFGKESLQNGMWVMDYTSTHRWTVEIPKDYDGLVYCLGQTTEYEPPSFSSGIDYVNPDDDEQYFRIIP